MPALTKNEMRPTISGKVFGGDFAAQIIQHRGGGGQREGEFLLGCRAGLLQVVGTHVHRVPFGQVFARVGGHIGDHAQEGSGGQI